MLSGLVAGGIAAVAVLVVLLFVWLFTAIGDSPASVVAMIILAVLGTVLSILLFSCIAIWANFVQIVVCMEEENRGSQALRRAYDLLRGHWVRVSGLITLLGLGMMALLAIFWAAGALLVGLGTLQDLFKGNSSDGAIWGLIGVWGASMVAIWIAWNPIFYLTLTLFYLDLRIRKEALDLEWSAHSTTPVEAVGAYPPGAELRSSTVETGAPVFASPQSFTALQGDAPTRPDSWYDALPATPAAPVPVPQQAAVIPIAPRVICAHCGASIAAAETCSNCGARLPQLPQPNDASPQPGSAPTPQPSPQTDALPPFQP